VAFSAVGSFAVQETHLLERLGVGTDPGAGTDCDQAFAVGKLQPVPYLGHYLEAPASVAATSRRSAPWIGAGPPQLGFSVHSGWDPLAGSSTAAGRPRNSSFFCPTVNNSRNSGINRSRIEPKLSELRHEKLDSSSNPGKTAGARNRKRNGLKPPTTKTCYLCTTHLVACLPLISRTKTIPTLTKNFRFSSQFQKLSKSI